MTVRGWVTCAVALVCFRLAFLCQDPDLILLKTLVLGPGVGLETEMCSCVKTNTRVFYEGLSIMLQYEAIYCFLNLVGILTPRLRLVPIHTGGSAKKGHLI